MVRKTDTSKKPTRRVRQRPAALAPGGGPLDEREWPDDGATGHVCRNVTVNGRRTSVRMEAVIWDSLNEIALREEWTLNDLCTKIDQLRGENGLTAALRVFILGYFREAAETGYFTQHGLREGGPRRNLSLPMRTALELLGDIDDVI